MKIRLYHARLLSFADGDTDIKENMQVGIEDGKILFVCPDTDKRNEAYVWDEERDCKGNLLLPGFKNCHTHSAMTFLRSKADDLPLQEWLNNTVFPAEAKLTAGDIYTFTKLAILEYLQSGITGIFEMYLTPESIAKACRECGMRITMTGGVNNFSQSVVLLEKWMNEFNPAGDLVRFVPGFHAEYTCSKELLHDIADLSKQYKMPVYAHISETAKEVAECKERYGMTPVAFLDSLGMFENGGGGYHMVYLEDEDYEIIRRRGLYVITNPGSNCKLASGIAPITKLLKEGIPVAIGTDGPASNNALDFFREMYLTSVLAKIRDEDAAALPAMEVLKMACHTGAHAMCIPESDSIAEGKNADLILLDLSQPNMQPLHNIGKNVVYAGSKNNVIFTMVNGKILYDNGEFCVGVSKEEIYTEANRIIERIF
ncbi:MAG: amidohydrolase [Lachnospiraceae bacterium]|nr:amidohydrolase [Lachnospiraceae bacterium]